MRAARSLTVLAAIAVAAAITSCGGDSTGPSNGVGTVKVTPATDSLVMGGTVSLTATVLDAAGHVVSGATVFWNTENANVATVSSNGAVTAIDTGTVRIAASSQGKSGFATITVIPKPVAAVHVTPPSAVLKVGGTIHLQANPVDAGGNALTGRTVTWTSDDATVASVDGTGLVTATGVGATTVHATCEGQVGTASIAVSAPTPAHIAVAPTSVSIIVGQTAQLTATVRDSVNAIITGAVVTWVSSNEAVATVSSTGLVSGKGEGTATVTAASGPVHVTVPVTISPVPADTVIISPSEATLLVTQQVQLQARVTDSSGNTLTGRPVTWKSDNTVVATVNATGLVTGLLPGTTIIRASSSGVQGTATITVKLVPTSSVSVDPDALTLFVGQNHQLTATALDSAGNPLTGRTATWSSTVPSVATVTTAGLVLGVAAGNTVIIAKIENQTGTSSVTIALVPVKTVTVTPSDTTLIQGDSVQLTATPRDSAGGALNNRVVTWKSSNTNVALVTSTGDVFSRGTGSATITATSEGVSGTATITVAPVPVSTVTVSPAGPDSVDIGGTQQFTATLKDATGKVLTGRTVTWSSDNTAAATIDANGLATGVSSGSATITATSEGKTGTATLVVRQPPVDSVAVTPPTATLVVGDSVQLTATPLDGNDKPLTGRVVTWASSDQTIATVTQAGLVNTLAPGTVTITATSEGKSGSSVVTVSPATTGEIIGRGGP